MNEWRPFGHAILARRNPDDPTMFEIKLDGLAGRREMKASFLDLINETPRYELDPRIKPIVIQQLRNPGSLRKAVRAVALGERDANNLYNRTRGVLDYVLERNIYPERKRTKTLTPEQRQAMSDRVRKQNPQIGKGRRWNAKVKAIENPQAPSA